jgi:GT2 family glycosyltransferase
MKPPKVTIGLILYKETKHLTYSLPGLLDQDYENIEYVFRDQSPDGEVYAYLEESHPEFFKKAKIVKGENLMHSGGHNEIIRHMKGEYYFCVSNDMLYPKDFVSRIITEMEKKKAKVATCKLMQWDYEKVLAGDLPASKTRIIDSFGISLTRGHQFYDAGQGKDERDLKRLPRIIGPSGALAVYHKDALKEIAYKNKEGKLEYFDELLHYKNDCDLAYRLSWAGFPCLLADVKVYHDRRVGHILGKSRWEIENSFLGHLITIKKNFDRRFSRAVKFRTFLFLGLRGNYMLIFHPRSLKVYAEVRKLGKEIRKKAKAIKKIASPQDIESLMV